MGECPQRVQLLLPRLQWTLDLGATSTHHHGGAGVVAIQSGRVCLVRQYRVVLGRVTLEIPAGKLEAGEQGESCAARELVEETGLRAEKLVHLGTPARRVSGLSLPMLLRVPNYPELDLDELARTAAAGARNGVVVDDA